VWQVRRAGVGGQLGRHVPPDRVAHQHQVVPLRPDVPRRASARTAARSPLTGPLRRSLSSTVSNGWFWKTTMLPRPTRWSIQPWYSSGPTPWVKATTGALGGVGLAGSKMVTLPGEPPTWVVRTPAWRCCLPPGPCGGCVGGVIARVAEGAADPVWSGAEPPVQPPSARTASMAHALG